MKEENEKKEDELRRSILSSDSNLDVGDVPSNKAYVSRFDIILMIGSILTHLVDVGFDVNVALQYLLNGKTSYFAWTVAFIYAPSIINVIISLKMFQQDSKEGQEMERYDTPVPLKAIIRRKSCIPLAVFLQLAPVLHYYDALLHAIKSRKCRLLGDTVGQKRHYLQMLKEDQDVALLRVFECFLEAAPQQVLQLILILKDHHDGSTVQLIHQLASISSSTVSMGWSMASYHRSIRLAQWDKLNISKYGCVFLFIWHFSITVSRIVSISAVGVFWTTHTVIACVLHWICMFGWIIMENHGIIEFCRDGDRPPHSYPSTIEKISSVSFAAVLGVVYVFTYLNPADGSTFIKHLFYYSFCIMENIAACLIWTLGSPIPVRSHWYYELVGVFCIVPFIIGITALVIYYRCLHPKKTNCLTTKKLMSNLKG